MRIFWTGPVRMLAQTGGMVLAACLSASLASAAEPAVRQVNGRVIGSFDHVQVGSDDVYNFAGPTPVLLQQPEESIDIGSVVGIVTVPLAPSVGARGFVGAVGAKRHIDNRDELEIGGIEVGGDIFWRNPELGEVGIGPRYIWTQVDVGSSSQSSHSGGAELTASLFVKDFGLGPIDLDFVASVLDSEVDPDRNGSFNPGRSYSASGGATWYLADIFSASLGGSWTRQNAGNGEHTLVKSADIDAELLLPSNPAVTLGAALSFGEQDFGLRDFANYGTPFWSIGVSVAVSFPGANSLVELNRFFY